MAGVEPGIGPSPAEGVPTLRTKVLAEVAEHVREPLRKGIEIAEERRGWIEVTWTVTHTVRFSIATSEATGPLPDSVQVVSSRDSVRGTLESRLTAARASLGERIDAWLARNAADPALPLPPEVGLPARASVGVKEACSRCAGRTRVPCANCSARGRNACTGCGGGGSTPCAVCCGTTNAPCTACGGTGRRPGRGPEVPDSRCDKCSATGKRLCGTCTVGRSPCARCDGTGSRPCTLCDAVGSLACAVCAATGWIHFVGRAVCEVESASHLEVTTDDEEDRRTIPRSVPLADLRGLGTVRFVESRHAEDRAILRHVVSIPVESNVVTVGSRSFPLRGYGPHCAVYNHRGVVGRLIEDDLAALERRLAAQGLRRWSARPSLLATTARLLASPVGRLVASAVTGPEAGVPPARSHALDGVLSVDLLSEDAVIRMSAAIRGALPRLHEELAAWRLVALAVGFFGLGLLARTAGVVPRSVLVQTAFVVAVVAGAWVLFEREIAVRLRRALGADLGDRAVLAAARSRTHRFVVAAAAALFGWMLSGL